MALLCVSRLSEFTLHDLTLIDPALPGALTIAAIDATMAYAGAEKAENTRRAYESDWRDFATWCAARGASPLPAHVGIAAAYLSDLADRGRKSSTIGRRAAAIGYHHKMAGHEPPTSAEGVRAVLRGIRRTIGTATAQKTAITTGQVVEIMKTCPATLIGRRDAALISFGFLSAMRRSELIALTIGDLTEVPDGLRIRIRRSKTDRRGAGDRHPARSEDPPGRGGAGLARLSEHLYRPRFPTRQQGRLRRRGGNDIGGCGAHRQEALCQDRPGPGCLCRTPHEVGVRHGRCRGERSGAQDS
jgi:integrase